MIALLSVVAGQAQQSSGILVLPVEFVGDASPVGSAAMSELIATRLRQLHPGVEVRVVKNEAELKAQGYLADSGTPPRPAVVRKLFRTYQVTHLAWVSLRLDTVYSPETETLSSKREGRFLVFDQTQPDLHNPEPQSVKLMSNTDNIGEGIAAMVVDAMVKLDAETLAERISPLIGASGPAFLQRRDPPSPPRSSPEEPSRSKNYSEMVRTIDAYNKASRRRDHVAVTNLQLTLTRIWRTLNGPEQKALEQDHPGIVEMMRADPIHDW